MNDSSSVQIFQGSEDLKANSGDLWFGHSDVCDDIGERASFHVFHHDPQLIANQMRRMHVDYVGVLIVSHYRDLE